MGELLDLGCVWQKDFLEDEWKLYHLLGEGRSRQDLVQSPHLSVSLVFFGGGNLTHPWVDIPLRSSKTRNLRYSWQSKGTPRKKQPALIAGLIKGNQWSIVPDHKAGYFLGVAPRGGPLGLQWRLDCPKIDSLNPKLQEIWQSILFFLRSDFFVGRGRPTFWFVVFGGTVDGWNPKQPPGMYKALQMMG